MPPTCSTAPRSVIRHHRHVVARVIRVSMDMSEADGNAGARSVLHLRTLWQVRHTIRRKSSAAPNDEARACGRQAAATDFHDAAHASCQMDLTRSHHASTDKKEISAAGDQLRPTATPGAMICCRWRFEARRTQHGLDEAAIRDDMHVSPRRASRPRRGIGSITARAGGRPLLACSPRSTCRALGRYRVDGRQPVLGELFGLEEVGLSAAARRAGADQIDHLHSIEKR